VNQDYATDKATFCRNPLSVVTEIVNVSYNAERARFFSRVNQLNAADLPAYAKEFSCHSKET